MKKKIRVLVVDDSVLMRRILSDLVASEKRMEVVGTAKNGLEAVKKTAELEPDVVLLDIEMPEMDGLTALTHIMEENPTPVVMVSALDAKDADVVLQSLDKGAVDFVSKPMGRSITIFDEEESKRLLEVVRNAASANISRPKPIKKVPKELETVEKPSFPSPPAIIIGASTGGPRSIKELLSYLPKEIPAYILIVQHMPTGFTRSFAERLATITGLPVVEAEDGEPLVIGKVLIAPGDRHMVVEKQGLDSYTVRLDKGPKVNRVRPSVDVTMVSIAQVFGPNTIGIILTGMGSDGAEGMSAIKKKGGTTIAEDKSSSVIHGMPRAAVNMGCVDLIAPLQEIPLKIMNLMT
jgi:two-component system chemotaxis response regulator CheB